MSLVLSSTTHCMYAAQPHSLAGNPSRPQTTSRCSSQQWGLPEPALSLSWLPVLCMLLGKRGKQLLEAQRLQWRKPLKRGGTTQNQPPFPSLLSSSVTLVRDTPTHPTLQKRKGSLPVRWVTPKEPNSPVHRCLCLRWPSMLQWRRLPNSWPASPMQTHCHQLHGALFLFLFFPFFKQQLPHLVALGDLQLGMVCR